MISLIVGSVAAWLTIPAFRAERRNQSVAGFRKIRTDLVENRVRHVVGAAELYESGTFIPGSRCMASPDWVCAQPIPIDSVQVEFQPTILDRPISGRSREATVLLPSHLHGLQSRYSDVIGGDADLRPGLWWDSPSFDLRGFEVAEGSAFLRCGVASYFEMFDVCESLAHEFVSARLAGRRSMPFRNTISDPFDLAERVFVPAVPMLPIFVDEDGSASFLMHARDSTEVASAGGFRHLIGGQFQPSSKHAVDFADEASLWRSIAREFAEELLGAEDAGGHSGGKISFDEPPFDTLAGLKRDGFFEVWLLGMGLDPLSLWPDILTVAVINGKHFQASFPNLVEVTKEGRTIGARSVGGQTKGFEFRSGVIDQICDDPMTAPAAGACLRLAWKHRETLLPNAS